MTRSGLANANGLGASGGGGAGGSVTLTTTPMGMVTHSFSLGGRQQTNTTRPPGFTC